MFLRSRLFMLHDRRSKWLYLISLSAVLSTLLVYFYCYPNPTDDSSAMFHPLITETDESPIDFIKPGYFVYSDACKIVELPVRTNSMEYFFKRATEFKSCAGWQDGKPRLVGANRTYLFIIKSAVGYYRDENSTLPIRCNYTPFTGEYHSAGNLGTMRAKYGKRHRLSSPVKITSDEFIRVECFLEKQKIYTDFFSFVPESKPTTSNSIPPAPKEEPEFSVLLLGIDAVSRLNFQRQMPKTYDYLNSHFEFLDMNGYNKIGDNTFPNLMAVLAGLSTDEVEKVCLPTHNATLDECPFVWKNFSEHGFKTLYAEDSFWMSTFYYQRSGFRTPPTDYFYSPYSMESEKIIGNSKLLNADLCIGSELVFKAILEYTLKFTTVLKNYFYFALVWTVSLSHDYLNLPRVGDSVLVSFFKNVYRNDNLNRTILILLSDHGLRWGSFRETYQGHLEERLPFLYFILPDTFKAKYSVAYRNLLFNQHRLTTPYDLHETLKDLYNLTNIRNELLKHKAQEEKKTPRGISLFTNIPDTRTCEHAGIPVHYCTCHNKMVNTSLESPIVQELSRIMLSHINNVLLKNVTTKCHELKLHEVVSAFYEQAIFYEKEESSSEGNWTRDYTITIITEPGLASFESTMRYNTMSDSKDIVGDVSRLNLYANQSSCVDDNRLKLYCYCR